MARQMWPAPWGLMSGYIAQGSVCGGPVPSSVKWMGPEPLASCDPGSGTAECAAHRFWSAELGSNPDSAGVVAGRAGATPAPYSETMKVPPKKGKHSCARALKLRPASATTSRQARRGHLHGSSLGEGEHLGQLAPRLHVCVTRRMLAAGFHIPGQRHIPEGRRRSKAQILRNKRSRETVRGQRPSGS